MSVWLTYIKEEPGVNKNPKKGRNNATVLRLLHTMNVRFSLLDIAERILGVTLPNFQ
jgi:hypothetical protein